MNQQEQNILKACQQNDRKAQFALYQLYKGKMLGLCRRYAISNAEAEDILQEAFIKVFKNINKIQKNESLGGWIRNIVVNTAIDFYRKSRYQTFEVQYEDALEKPDNDFFILEKLTNEEIINTMQQLPNGYRMVLNLYVIEGYSHDEIAKMLNISVGTSKSQLSRAKEQLRTHLKKIGIVV